MSVAERRARDGFAFVIGVLEGVKPGEALGDDVFNALTAPLKLIAQDDAVMITDDFDRARQMARYVLSYLLRLGPQRPMDRATQSRLLRRLQSITQRPQASP